MKNEGMRDCLDTSTIGVVTGTRGRRDCLDSREQDYGDLRDHFLYSVGIVLAFFGRQLALLFEWLRPCKRRNYGREGRREVERQ